MKNVYFLVLASVFAVSGVVAQERSAGGSQETQMSWSALKTMATAAQDTANTALTVGSNAAVSATAAKVRADQAFTVGSNAAVSATQAKQLADNIRYCQNSMKFYDPDNTKANGRGCAALTDLVGSDDILRASKTTLNMDSGDIKNLAKQNGMMFSIGCSVTIGARGIGRPGEAGFICKPQSDKNYAVYMGTPRTKDKWTKVIAGKGSYSNAARREGEVVGSCGASSSGDTVWYFVTGSEIFEGSMINTPAGTKILGKSKVMDLGDWDGRIKYDTCDGVVNATYYSG